MLALLSLTVAAQADVARLQAWNPDPTLSFELPVAPRFIRTGAKIDGALELFQDREHPASLIVVSFFPQARLDSRVRTSHEELLRLVPNKRVEPLESKVLTAVFSASGLRFAAFSYPSGPKTAAGGSICDSAAVHWETAGGVWTVSANGDLGDAAAIRSVLDGFLSNARLTDLNQLARQED